MDVREKLVEIIQNSVGGCARHWAEIIADGLIAHGVTVQDWISVKDHTPKEKGCYLIAGNHWWDGKPVAREAYWNGDDWLSCYDKANVSCRVKHWQHLPQPPKGE